MNKLKEIRLPIKESYLLIIIIIGIISLCMYSSFALFSLEKTSKNDIVTMKAASDIQTNLSIYEYKEVKVSSGDNTSIMLNVNNNTGGSIYYGVFYEMVSPNVKTDDIGIYKIDWSKNATSGSITNGSTLPVELLIVNNSSSEITINIGVAGSSSNELGLTYGKTLITETFDTGKEPDGSTSPPTTTTVNYSYTGAVQTATLKAGTHKLEVWGAQGGDYSSSAVGGKGGYSYGTLTLTTDTNAYIYVGGQPDTNTSDRVTVTGGFNGGGNGFNRYYSGTYTYGQGGGGASDIRLVEDSLYSRVIVAGGGGGAASEDGSAKYGGGTSGGSSQSGYGASQTSAGTNGSFGTGGSATTSGNNYKYGSGGGGGGWYGGGAASSYSDSTNYRSYNGGGSGYVYTSSTASNYPSGVKLNSSYYLSNAATVAGNTSFTDNTGSTVTGHSGNGYARITSTVGSDTTPSIDTSSVTLKPTIITNLKDIVTCNDNGNGCKIVLVSPSNTKNMKNNETNEVLYVLEDNDGQRLKYKKKVTLKDGVSLTSFIESLDDGTTGDSGSGVYKVTHSVIAAESSATGSEIPASTDYRYYGASPNNYICLDMEGGSSCPDKHLYRIIGSIYEEKENTNRIKVIKATPLTDGTTSTFSWNYTSSGSYTNIWATVTSGNYSNSLTSGSTLMILLNSGAWWKGTTGTYYNNSTTATKIDFTNYKLSDKAKDYITTSRYYLGGNNTSSGVLTNSYYSYERGTKRYDTSRPLYWDGNIGLMYPSDYGYAAGNTCVTGTGISSYDSSCKSNDWLFNSKDEWLMSPYSGSSTYTFHLRSSGYGYYYYVNYSRTVRPVFYLSKDVIMESGSGTSSKPYIISK